MWFSQIVKVMHNTSSPLSLLKLTVKFNWSVYLRQVPQQEPDGINQIVTRQTHACARGGNKKIALTCMIFRFICVLV